MNAKLAGGRPLSPSLRGEPLERSGTGLTAGGIWHTLHRTGEREISPFTAWLVRFAVFLHLDPSRRIRGKEQSAFFLEKRKRKSTRNAIRI